MHVAGQSKDFFRLEYELPLSRHDLLLFCAETIHRSKRIRNAMGVSALFLEIPPRTIDSDWTDVQINPEWVFTLLHELRRRECIL
jgi:hypothetical protein